MTTHMNRRATIPAGLLASLVLAACTGAGSGTVAPTATASMTASLPATPAATPLPGTPTTAPSTQPSSAASPEPTSSLEPFACSFPLEGDGTTDRAQLTDVRIGQHDGYDRIVFEFDGGIPPYTISEATPPFTEDPSGLPLEVEGAYAWQIVLNGGTKMTPEGASSYAGSTDFTPDFDKLVELVEGGDFEAVSTWYVGMSGSSCIRVLALDDPARLVIDIEH
jgi:hypothetical protein